ncbi:MAG: asparaginase [Xanthobacteraceae bacterium]
MEKVIVLTTGGTIAHRSSRSVAVLDFDPKALAADLGVTDVELEFRAVFAKGSMAIVPEDWKNLAAAAGKAIADGAGGIVILHGTDTMHYTAAALSFMLLDPSMPVVFTGSMIPGGDPGTDALSNLRDAVRVAAAADLGEVCVVFSANAERTRGVIIRGVRARKIRSYAIDAFASINAPPIGYVENDKVHIDDAKARPRGAARPRLAAEIEENVVLVKLNPAVTPQMLARYLLGAAGAVIEGTGIGHIRSELHPALVAFGKPVVMTTQAIYGGERLGTYDADRAILAIPNLIPAGDMTSETALVKLMWAFTQGGNIRTIIRTNVAGECAGALGKQG